MNQPIEDRSHHTLPTAPASQGGSHGQVPPVPEGTMSHLPAEPPTGPTVGPTPQTLAEEPATLSHAPGPNEPLPATQDGASDPSTPYGATVAPEEGVPIETPQGLFSPTVPPEEGMAIATPQDLFAPTVPPEVGIVVVGPATASKISQPKIPRKGKPGVDVPGYDILRELGRGGMGVVYEAHHRVLDRRVALKMVLSGAHATPDQLERFLSEARAVAQLQNPGIVQIFDIGEHDGLPYFSLEYCDGGSLSGLTRRRPQPPRAAAEMVEKLARAVQAAHEKNVIHRDLKPANVLLADCQWRGGPPGRDDEEAALARLIAAVPKIADFGLARRLEGDAGQTRDGTVMGSPSYMAPEQAAGKVSQVGPLADVYSLGATLYELLTGRPPFVGTGMMDTLEQVRTKEPVPPTQLAGAIPKDLETICLKCLRKEPERRYPSAGALAEDLRRYLDGIPILGRPVPTWERVYRWGRRHPKEAGLVGLAALLLVALAGASIVVAQQEVTRTRLAEAGQRQEAKLRGEAEIAEKKEKEQRILAEKAEEKEKEQRIKAQEAEKNEKEQRQIAETRKRDAEEAQKQERLQRVAAEKARSAASLQRYKAVDTLRFLYLEADQELRDHSLTLPVRERLLTKAVERITDLQKVEEGAPSANPLDVRTEAGTHQRLGEVLLQAGRIHEADTSYKKALALCLRLVEAAPDDPAHWHNVANAHNICGDTRGLLGDAAGMLAHYQEGAKRRQRLIEMVPQHIPYQHALAVSHTLCGKACLALGRPAEARDYFSRSLKAFESLPTDYLKSVGLARLERANAEEFLGEASLRVGDRPAASAHFGKALETRRTLGTSATARRLLARSNISFGDMALLAQSNPASALGHYQAALVEFERAWQNEPERILGRRDRALVHYRLGATCDRMAHVSGPLTALPWLAAGRAHYARSLQLQEELAKIDAKNTQAQVDYMLILARMGRFAEAIKIAEKLRGESQKDARVLSFVAAGLGLAGRAGEGVAVLMMARQAGYVDLFMLERDPDFDGLRGHPEFSRCLQELRARLRS